jgi:hypothetical protein
MSRKKYHFRKHFLIFVFSGKQNSSLNMIMDLGLFLLKNEQGVLFNAPHVSLRKFVKLAIGTRAIKLLVKA